ncbi:MAG: DUF2336 domain-containing protein [Methylobacterium frigidaeris]
MSRSAAGTLSDLIEFARDRRLDIKPVLLRVQTDLFVSAPVRDAGTLRDFEALACGLIPTVDAATAAIVAQKLAPLADTPQAVLELLAARGGEARDAVLSLSPHLSLPVLDAAESGPVPDPAIARRGDLSRRLVDDLAALGDPAIDRALAGNTAIVLAGPALERLVARARDRGDLAEILLRRTDLPAADLAPLYLQAGAPLRAAIRAALAATAALRPQTRPRGAPGASLAGFAGRGERERFDALLAASLGHPGAGLDLSVPARYDLLALALRAAEVSEDDAFYIFLRLEPAIGRSVQTVFALARLFRETDPATARDLVASILGQDPARRGGAPDQHQPHHGPASPRLRPAAPAARPGLPERVRRTS